MTALVRTALVLLLLAPAARADEGWALIGGGGPDRVDGELALAEARRVADELHLSATGFPRVVRSDDVRGLKPGLHVVLLGVCATKDEATRVRESLRTALPHAYLRRVEGVAIGCPVVSTAAATRIDGPSGDEQRVAFPDEARAWVITTPVTRRDGDAVLARDLVIELEKNDRVLDRLHLTGESGEREHPQRAGERILITTRSAEVVEVIRADTTPLLLVGETREPDGEHGATTYSVVDACGDRIRARSLFDCGFGAMSRCRLEATIAKSVLRVCGGPSCTDEAGASRATVTLDCGARD